MDITTFIGRFHPLVVHLPIGFLLMSAILKVLNVRFSNRFPDLDGAISISLLLGGVSGMLACFLGYSLSLEGGYDPSTLFWHKWLGIGVVVISFSSFWLHIRPRSNKYISHSLFAIFSVLLLFTGHLGGNLTHGSDYLIAHAPQVVQNVFGYNNSNNAQLEIPSDLDSIGIYTHLVRPVLDAKCVTCHNATKGKGGLDISTAEAMLAGGDDGLFVSAGDTHESGLFKRVTLNPSSKKYMPPSGSPMSYNEIKLIEWWITEGASVEDRIGGKEIPDDISYILWQEFKIDTKPKEFYDQISVATLDEEVLNTLNSSGFIATKISTQHELLEVRMEGIEPTSSKLSELSKVKDHVIWLDLSGQNIEADEWKHLSQLKNLSMLKLNNSSIRDLDLTFMEDLGNLEILNLYGTMISNESVSHLSSLKSLKRIYLWGTNFTPEGISQLQESLPNLEIVFES